MRIIIFFCLLLTACNNNNEEKSTSKDDSFKTPPKTTQIKKEPKADSLQNKTYANQRFRNVTIERISNDSFTVHGQGQIFEASFGWVIEDGHNELKQGFAMTDAGAPEWGNFDFGFTVPKEKTNSTLTLVLFESSAKDGSRQHQLPIVLY